MTSASGPPCHGSWKKSRPKRCQPSPQPQAAAHQAADTAAPALSTTWVTVGGVSGRPKHPHDASAQPRRKATTTNSGKAAVGERNQRAGDGPGHHEGRDGDRHLRDRADPDRGRSQAGGESGVAEGIGGVGRPERLGHARGSEQDRGRQEGRRGDGEAHFATASTRIEPRISLALAVSATRLAYPPITE